MTSQNCCRFWRHNDLIEVKDRRYESHSRNSPGKFGTLVAILRTLVTQARF